MSGFVCSVYFAYLCQPPGADAVTSRHDGAPLPGPAGGTAGPSARPAGAPAPPPAPRDPFGAGEPRAPPCPGGSTCGPAALPGRALTAAQLVPEGGGGGGGSAAGCGRWAAVPALVSELAAALLEPQPRSLPDGGHQLRLLLAQVLLPAAQRWAGAARLLRPAGGGDAQPPAEAALWSAPGPGGHEGTGAAQPSLPRPATHIQVPQAAGRQKASSSTARSRRGPRGAPRPMAAASSPAAPPLPAARLPSQQEPRRTAVSGAPYSALSFSGGRGQLAGAVQAVGEPSR